MKHTPSITVLMLVLFLVAQLVGMVVVSRYLTVEQTLNPDTNQVETEVVGSELPFDVERPKIEESVPSIVLVGFVLGAIFIGTGLMLILIRFGQVNLWKIWYLLAVIITLTVAFFRFVPEYVAVIMALVLAVLKVYRPSTFFQNLTEIFIYGGLAAIIVPINKLTVLPTVLILLAISVYDFIAVNHTKHMVTMANFQTKSKLFAGLLVPYQKETTAPKKTIKPPVGAHEKTEKVRIAVLGGGDIGFPLIFAGVVMKTLIIENSALMTILKALPIPICAAAMLMVIFMLGRKDKFYPAMPFITLGCLLGYGFVWLLF